MFVFVNEDDYEDDVTPSVHYVISRLPDPFVKNPSKLYLLDYDRNPPFALLWGENKYKAHKFVNFHDAEGIFNWLAKLKIQVKVDIV